MNYLVANWKSNKNIGEAVGWLDEFAKVYSHQDQDEVVIGASYVFLSEMKKRLNELSLPRVSLAAQDVSPFPAGAYTGAVQIEMIAKMVKYVIVGHSERREYFHETNQEIANKVALIQDKGLMPILCVDEPYAREQLAALEDGAVDQLVVAYEPLEAIGSGTPQKTEEVSKVVAEIKQMADVPILYGGSVKPANVSEIVGLEDVSGALVGGASLEAGTFAELVKNGEGK